MTEPQLRIMSEDELQAMVSEMDERIAASDEEARAAGRIFLNEETDRSIINGWYEQAHDIKTPDDAAAFANGLMTTYRHDYGTLCHAVAASAVAMAAATGYPGGITGFQAGAVMWEFCRNWLHWDTPHHLIDYGNLRYPQYADDFTRRTIPTHVWKWLQDEARKSIAAERDDVHPRVLAHWESIAAGIVPFGLTVENN